MKKEIIIYNDIEFYKIPHIDNYYVSKCGKVYSYNRNIIMKTQLNKGYERLKIVINKKPKFICVHQLVAITFLGLEVDNMLYSISKLQVNHINEVKTDNNLENLELVTVRQNKLHSTKNKVGTLGVYETKGGVSKPYNSRIQINNIDIFLGHHPSIESASRIYQLALQNIHLFDNDSTKFRNLIRDMYEIEKGYI